jgi:hypothetical protein
MRRSEAADKLAATPAIRSERDQKEVAAPLRPLRADGVCSLYLARRTCAPSSGLHWMHKFRSAILPFVGRDASYLADHIDDSTQEFAFLKRAIR